MPACTATLMTSDRIIATNATLYWYEVPLRVGFPEEWWGFVELPSGEQIDDLADRNLTVELEGHSTARVIIRKLLRGAGLEFIGLGAPPALAA